MVARNELKKIGIFGSTGSIGTQAVSIIEQYPDFLTASLLTCDTNTSLLRLQMASLKPKVVVITGTAPPIELNSLALEFPETRVLTGSMGLTEAAEYADYDVMLNALTGIVGLMPTWKALKTHRDIAIANKETLVAGGEFVMTEARKQGSRIIPVDSEHSAVFQAIQGNEENDVHAIILTASGGPFRGYSRDRLKDVSPEQALKHPNWKMGRKVSVDSATMVNKGLEIIEASRLFGMPEDKINVIVHPQSIVHSMVEFEDGSIMAQMGAPDMKIPISYALCYPKRLDIEVKRLNLSDIGALTFEYPDEAVFPALRLARKALRTGGGAPAVFNAANEALVELFLGNRIRFTDIDVLIERALEFFVGTNVTDVETVLELDDQVKAWVWKNVR